MMKVMTIKHRLKKASAVLLAAAMMLGTVQTPRLVSIAWAADTSAEPSVTAYATKNELMTAFTPNAEGTSDVIGKITFGKNESGNTMTWYVIGKDEGVPNAESSNDNIAIFAAQDISSGLRQFYNEALSYNITPDKIGVVYADSRSETFKVNYNHYGGSVMRSYFNGLTGENDKICFTSYEKSLMQATTVRTEDWKNSKAIFTTSDKLYAASGDRFASNVNYIYVGSSISDKTNDFGRFKLTMKKYWASGNWFWLRSPTTGNGAHYAPPGGNLGYNNVTNATICYYRPATNLNLSSVLFASSAPAASSTSATGNTIAMGTAMTLRLDGSDKNIGCVIYDATGQTISVVRGTTDSVVSLVVQGKNGETDWYYTKQIENAGETSATVTISAEDIAATVNASASLSLTKAEINLDSCKTWLETTVEGSSTLSYAVQAAAHTHSYGSEWKYDARHHYHECTNNCPLPDKGISGSGSENAEHVYDANSVTPNKCTVCEYWSDHKHSEHMNDPVIRKDATCTASGNELYYECSYCHTVWKDALRTQKTTIQERTIPKLAHTMKKGKCSVCGYRVPSSDNDDDGGDYANNTAKGSAEAPTAGPSGVTTESLIVSTSGGPGTSTGQWKLDSGQNATNDKADGDWRFILDGERCVAGTIKVDSAGNAVEYIEWAKIDDAWYAFGADGYMKSGWVYDAATGNWYYCDIQKGVQTGWHLDAKDGKWYYLDPVTGAMYTGRHIIDGKTYDF